MPSPILARADALMNRKWQTGTEAQDDIPVLTETIADDDIPVLLDIEPTTIATPVALESPTHAPAPTIDIEYDNPAAFSPEQFEQLARQLGQRVEQRLQAALPGIVASALQELLADRLK